MELHGEGLETTQFTGLRAHQHPVIQRYCGKGVCVCVLWYVGDQTGVLWAYLLTSCIGLNLPLWLSQVVGVFYTVKNQPVNKTLWVWSPVVLHSLDR